MDLRNSTESSSASQPAISIGTRAAEGSRSSDDNAGYAAFSYADLSRRVGVRKASIHHHFRTKEELGVALIDTYLVTFKAALAHILATKPKALPRLRRYAAFFAGSLQDGSMPLCGALSAEAFALRASMQQRVRDFFELHLGWLEGVLRDGAPKAPFIPISTSGARPRCC